MGGGYAYGVAAFSGVGMFLYGYDAGVIATTFGNTATPALPSKLMIF